MKSAQLSKEKKDQILKEFGGGEKNTGATEVQIAIFTERINYLTEHFKTHKKDFHSKTGLIRLVNKRRKMLDFLKKNDEKAYQELISRLGIRK